MCTATGGSDESAAVGGGHSGQESPSRRAVLAGAVGAAIVATVSGCGLRWESDAPADLPVLDHERYPGAGMLQAELAAVEVARAATAAFGDAEAVAANSAQIEALVRRLVAVGAIRPGDSTDHQPPSVPQEPAVATPSGADVIRLRGDAAAAQWAGMAADFAPHLAGGSEQDVLLVGSVQVGRSVLGRRLGGRPAALSPADGFTGLATETIAPVLERARATAYALDIAAARAPETRRAAATGSRDAVHRILVDLDAAARDGGSGDAAAPSRASATPEPGTTPPPPLGYPVTPPTTPAQVDALAASQLTALADTLIAAMPATVPLPVPGDVAGSELRTYTALHRRAAECEHWQIAWGGTLRALPGLVPATPGLG